MVLNPVTGLSRLPSSASPHYREICVPITSKIQHYLVVMGRSTLLNLLATALSATTAHAHYGYDWQGDEGGGSSCPPWAYDCDGSDNGESSGSGSDGSSSNGIAQGVFFSDSAQFNKATRILIAHAAMASLVWVLFVPSMAILLRPNIKSPIILKLHAVGQILSYIIYIVAAGMGIWLARQVDTYTSGGVWNDPHPKLGLAILALAFFQPIVSMKRIPSLVSYPRC